MFRWDFVSKVFCIFAAISLVKCSPTPPVQSLEPLHEQLAHLAQNVGDLERWMPQQAFRNWDSGANRVVGGSHLSMTPSGVLAYGPAQDSTFAPINPEHLTPYSDALRRYPELNPVQLHAPRRLTSLQNTQERPHAPNSEIFEHAGLLASSQPESSNAQHLRPDVLLNDGIWDGSTVETAPAPVERLDPDPVEHPAPDPESNQGARALKAPVMTVHSQEIPTTHTYQAGPSSFPQAPPDTVPEWELPEDTSRLFRPMDRIDVNEFAQRSFTPAIQSDPTVDLFINSLRTATGGRRIPNESPIDTSKILDGEARTIAFKFFYQRPNVKVVFFGPPGYRGRLFLCFIDQAKYLAFHPAPGYLSVWETASVVNDDSFLLRGIFESFPEQSELIDQVHEISSQNVLLSVRNNLHGESGKIRLRLTKPSKEEEDVLAKPFDVDVFRKRRRVGDHETGTRVRPRPQVKYQSYYNPSLIADATILGWMQTFNYKGRVIPKVLTVPQANSLPQIVDYLFQRKSLHKAIIEPDNRLYMLTFHSRFPWPQGDELNILVLWKVGEIGENGRLILEAMGFYKSPRSFSDKLTPNAVSGLHLVHSFPEAVELAQKKSNPYNRVI